MAAFSAGLQQAVNQITTGGVFAGDNLFTFGRNLSFLHDTAFMAAFEAHASTVVEKAVIWRVHTLAWAAKRGLAIPGDFVECACYKGISARIVADYVKLGETDKDYFLYDLFEHPADANHHSMPEHGADLYGQVKARFADLANVHVTQGKVPEILAQISPKIISFLHLDLNNAEAEIGALNLLWDRISPGGTVVLDDYGWLGYQAQKIAEDAFFAERGYSVLELPTGQGLVIK
jgi:hypothetical protein